MTTKSALLFGTILCVAPALLPAAATIVIVNIDAAGVGFNDATVVAPVGGNTGTTLGQQRLIAFQAAANKWGATINSVPTIRVQAKWTPLTCGATFAVLGSAGAAQVARDFLGAPRTGTWFSVAEGNAIVGATADPATPEINANFNVNLGQPGCLTGIFFYLGLDNNHGNNVDLVTVLEHEFGHGLGFANFTNGSDGSYFLGFPSIWDWFLFDNTTSKLWKDMTAAERVTSAKNDTHLVWSGSLVTSNVPNVLGTPRLLVTAPASVAATYSVGTASFGQQLAATNLTAEVMPVVDTFPPTVLTPMGFACGVTTGPMSALNALAVSGKIALVDRGVCGFAEKAKTVQNAGAVGIIIVNNAAGAAPALGGTDATVTIPAVSISQADGNILKAALATRSRTHSGMFANISLNRSLPQGADGSNRSMMYAPTSFTPGSSVSHYDTRAFPNQLMEPAINGDLTHEITVPYDLTHLLLRDIGWP